MATAAVNADIDKLVMHRDHIDWATAAGNAIASTMTGYLDRNSKTPVQNNPGFLGEVWNNIQASLMGGAASMSMLGGNGAAGSNVANQAQANTIAQESAMVDTHGMGGDPYGLNTGSALPLGNFFGSQEYLAGLDFSGSAQATSGEQSQTSIKDLLIKTIKRQEFEREIALFNKVKNDGAHIYENDTLAVKLAKSAEISLRDHSNELRAREKNDLELMRSQPQTPLIDPMDRNGYNLDAILTAPVGLVSWLADRSHNLTDIAKVADIAFGGAFALGGDKNTAPRYVSELRDSFLNGVADTATSLLNLPQNMSSVADIMIDPKSHDEAMLRGELLGKMAPDLMMSVLPVAGEFKVLESGVGIIGTATRNTVPTFDALSVEGSFTLLNREERLVSFNQFVQHVNDTGLSSAFTQPLTDVYANVYAVEKASRPPVSTYLKPDFVDNHTELFANGAARVDPTLTFNTRYQASIEAGLPFGRQDAVFVSPSPLIDSLYYSGNSMLESTLGFPPGTFNSMGGVTRTYIDNPGSLGLRFAQGNESGANPMWVPEGYTFNANGGIGVPEMVTNQLPSPLINLNIKVLQ